MYPSLLHQMAPFCMNAAKKSSGGGPPRPPFKQNSFRSYYTHKKLKITIETPQQLNTLYYVLVVCKTLSKHRKLCPAPSVYQEINFPAEPMMKINTLYRPNVPAPPPPPPSGSNGRPLNDRNLAGTELLLQGRN